jgi:transcriptional regulator with XRE-family HTH domain
MDDARRPSPDERGAWLREARQRAGYARQADFARAIGVDKSLLSNYETGKTRPSDDSADRIARALKRDIFEVRRGLGLWAGPVDRSTKPVTLDDFTDAQLLAELTRRTEARLEPDPEIADQEIA